MNAPRAPRDSGTDEPLYDVLTETGEVLALDLTCDAAHAPVPMIVPVISILCSFFPLQFTSSALCKNISKQMLFTHELLPVYQIAS